MPTVKVNQREVLDTFIDQMIAEKGMQGVDQAILKEQLRTKLDEQIEQAIIRSLSDEKLLELDKLLDDEADDDTLEKFFEEAGENYGEVAEQTMQLFKEAFLKSGTEGE